MTILLKYILGVQEGVQSIKMPSVGQKTRHDKEGMKTAVREDFKTKFNNQRFGQASREDKGNSNEEVNRSLDWDEFEANLKVIKDPNLIWGLG